MGKRLLTLLILGLLLFSPNLLFADCLSLAGYTAWVAEGDRKIIFYRGTRPIAAVKPQDCRIYPSSSLLLIKSLLCDGDKIIIDNAECNIMTVDSLAF